MHQRSEQEIMKNWKGDIDKPIVSVCCVTYNHEEYISDALDGMLMQETDFPFEIIVRDDASSDNTANIIKEYENKYPDIIKPMYEKENGYQKGIKIIITAIKNAKGKFIALCEGDDYWIDSKKLQKQMKAMNQNSSCNICFNPAYLVFGQTLSDTVFGVNVKENKIFTVSDVVGGGGGFMPTASLMIRKKVFDNLPEIFFRFPNGDYITQILASLEGGAIYINEIMCIYRREVASSWSNKMKNIDVRREHLNKVIKSRKELNAFLEYKYEDEILSLVNKEYYSLAKEYLKKKLFNDFEDLYKLYSSNCQNKKLWVRLAFLIGTFTKSYYLVHGFHEIFIKKDSKILSRIIKKFKG